MTADILYIIMKGPYSDLGSTSDWLCPEGICFSQSLKHWPDLDSDTLLVWSFCACCNKFLRQHSAEKTVAVLQNVGVFFFFFSG